MAAGRGGHDFRLLDQLGECEGQGFDGRVWRVVRSGRSPLDGSRGAGRWNPRNLSVLYTAQEAEGALGEIHFHLSLGQSVFPSRMRHTLFELRVRAEAILVFDSMAALAGLGVEEARYSGMLYDRTQEVASAAAFLGFEGLIAPSARWRCSNLILFLDNVDEEKIEIESETPIDWARWIAHRRR